MGNDLRVSGRSGRPGLPASLSSFVGRADELARLEVLLSRHRLVTVVGPGGSGKTRLAVEVARRLAARFEDGVFVAELAQIEDTQLVGKIVAGALGVGEHEGMSMVDAVAEVVARRHLLLLLDNCEHLVEAAAELCETLLAAGEDLRVLATSHEALGVSGEVRFALGPLPVPPSSDRERHGEDFAAVTLFADRAAQADSTFELTPATEPAVASLARRLDGMPLAIELAAAQLDVLSLEDLAAGLEDGFTVLVSHSRDVPARHTSLASALEWSYRLLDGPQQRAFRRLSIFPAPFTVAAAEAAAGPGAAALVASLVRRSMLVPHGSGPDGRSRYTMLETLRAYGAELLDESGERHETASAVASWTIAEAEATAATFDTPDDAPVGWWGDAEQENLRDVLEWLIDHDPPRALRLGVAMGPWWFLRGLYREGRSSLDRAIAASPGAPSEVLAAAEMWVGRLALYSSDFNGAVAHYGKVEALLADAASCPLIVDILNGRVIALSNLGRTGDASEAVARALAMAREIGYASGEIYASAVSAMVALYAGDFGSVLAQIDAIQRLPVDGVSGHTARWAATIVAEGLAIAGDAARAELTLLDTLERCRRAGDRSWAAKQLDALARLELATGRPDAAAAHVEEAIRISFEIGDLLRLADCFATAAVWARSRSPESAAVLWGAYRAIAASIGWHPVPLAEIDDQADPESAYDSLFVTRPMLEIRESLGTELAGEADGRGAHMARNAAVAFALALLTEPAPTGGDQHSALFRLSSRERELLALVAEGLTDGQIAEKMFISIRTVGSHLDRIRDKTGCRRRAELTRLAVSIHDT